MGVGLPRPGIHFPFSSHRRYSRVWAGEIPHRNSYKDSYTGPDPALHLACLLARWPDSWAEPVMSLSWC